MPGQALTLSGFNLDKRGLKVRFEDDYFRGERFGTVISMNAVISNQTSNRVTVEVPDLEKKLEEKYPNISNRDILDALSAEIGGNITAAEIENFVIRVNTDFGETTGQRFRIILPSDIFM